ncbi:MAG: hypothetical protein ACFFD4_33395 [Candidatus Odinarchaeota archaeon]
MMVDIREKQVLKELYKDKRFTASQIAEMAGCTRGKVYYWLRNHEIEKNPTPKSASDYSGLENAAKIRKLYVNRHLSIKEIADHFKCSKSCVRYWLAKHRVKNPPTA